MELLKQLYGISSKSGMEERMKSFVLDCVSDVELSVETDEIGNLFITKGEAELYPCIAAHLDEIHSPCEREVVIEGDKIFTVDRLWNRVGCGADDKNGLWIIINLLHSEPVLKVALFVQEERAGDIAGCRGARACDLSFFSDVKFVLECDRKGSSDVVFIGKGDTQLCEQDFIPQQLLNKYGYEMVKGGKTDVVELKMRGLQIPVCNISCGYYDVHKNSEYTLFPELQNCLSFVRDVLKVFNNKLLQDMKIPGLSFSLKRAVGVTKIKQKVSKATGIPMTKQGLERKIGGSVVKAVKGKKKK